MPRLEAKIITIITRRATCERGVISPEFDNYSPLDAFSNSCAPTFSLEVSIVFGCLVDLNCDFYVERHDYIVNLFEFILIVEDGAIFCGQHETHL
jgi:hypothetical protein